MPLDHDHFLAALANLSREQIRQAGQRYTPGLDPQAPNLKIAPLLVAIENVACGAGAQRRFQGFIDELSDAWACAQSASQQRESIQAVVAQVRASVAPVLTQARLGDPQAFKSWSVQLDELETHLNADLEHWRAEEKKLPRPKSVSDYSTSRDTVRGHIDAIRRCLGVVTVEQDYAKTAAFQVLSDPQLLIGGAWGTGKAHLLCDVTRDRLDRGLATLLVLAKNFEGRVVLEICGCIEPDRTVEDIFDQLQTEAERSGERVIVMVDGVNEGRRREWRQAITTLRMLVGERPGLGLIVACRTPFEPVAIEPSDLDALHPIAHTGFDDQAFDAQAAFFQRFNLPLPEVPLLDQEFSRPLTLKLICQSLQRLKGKKLESGFAGIASGQKGMTYVLESFVGLVGQPVEAAYGLPPKSCWVLLKGSDQIADRRLAGFAPCMAAKLRGYVRPAEADRIIAAHYPNFGPAQRRRFLESLRTCGLLEEDVVWHMSGSVLKSRIVFRLPYERFSDHLVARHLLKTYLDVSSEASIRDSFAPGSPLSRIFRVARGYARGYAEPGWAQALITEFPERAGTRLPPERRELFFVLPLAARRLSAYFEPFVQGLFWRNPATFTKGTHQLINRYLATDSRTWEQLIDALAAVSTKINHPYSARRLYNYLSRYDMAERDLAWSEYLRRRYASPTIHRLLTWAGQLKTASMSEPTVRELIALLSLVLTTVVRSDRDLATKSLVIIGEQFPELLFEHTLTGLSFNDPYVPERLLAAAYGVTLSQVDGRGASAFRPVLARFAGTLYDQMFASDAGHATHHALMRDYALGIIEVARHAGALTLPATADRDLTIPFPNTPSTFASNGTPDAAVSEALGHPIQMDFGNYTIGHLIPDRANYDDKHPEYILVRAKIERRMLDLGYREALFGDIDNQIGRDSYHARDDHKVDRYGKKYSWIAYFEMWGERDVMAALPDWRQGKRTVDCDIDPSFPRRPPAWIPPMPDLIGNVTMDTEAWVGGHFTPAWDALLVVPEINGHTGRWVLVEGFVCGQSEELDRELFAFLRGVFVARADIPVLQTEFLATEYPGNQTIPEGIDEHYLYAGEAGRRRHYAQALLQRNGRYRRQTAEMFERYVPIEEFDEPPALIINVDGVAAENESDVWRRFVFPRTIQRTQRVPGIRVELPTTHFAWESYHSTQNNFSGFDLPAPALIQRLGLASRDREVDFYDAEGRPGILYREAGGEWQGDRHRLMYMRADLLRRYLTQTRQTLVWFNWGERNWLKKMELSSVIDDPARRQIYQAHRHIHRSFSVWETSRVDVYK